MLNGRSGILQDLGRIDCFAIDPHHHTQTPTMNAAVECPEEIRIDVAEKGKRLNLAEWKDSASQCVDWLRNDWVRELKESGWGEWVINAAEREKAAMVTVVEEYLFANPPSGLASE
jgi:hypothetical protein